MPSTVAADDLDGRANLYWTRSYCGRDVALTHPALTHTGAKDGALTLEHMPMNTLTTNRNHLVASRLYALAADARRSALENCIAWIERGIVIPPYCRIDTAVATYHADQARSLRARAVAARNGTRTY